MSELLSSPSRGNKGISLPSLATVASIVGGLGALGLAATFNARHAATGASDPTDAALQTALAVAMTVGFVTSTGVVAAAWRGGNWGRVTAAGIAAVLTGAASLFNITGAIHKQRMTEATVSVQAVERASTTRKHVGELERELAALGTTMPSAAIRASIDAKLVSRRDLDGCEARWLPSSAARAVCIDVNALRSDLAKAEAREAVAKKLAEARGVIGMADAGKVAGASDVPFVRVLRWAGVTSIDNEAASLVVSVAQAFALELLAALLLAHAGQGGGARNDTPARATPAKALASFHTGDACHPSPCPSQPETAEIKGASGTGEGVTSNPVVLTVPADPGDRLLALLQTSGGEVFGGLRSFGRALGVSHTEAGRILSELASAGRVVVESGKRGTMVRLVEGMAAAA